MRVGCKRWSSKANSVRLCSPNRAGSRRPPRRIGDPKLCPTTVQPTFSAVVQPDQDYNDYAEWSPVSRMPSGAGKAKDWLDVVQIICVSHDVHFIYLPIRSKIQGDVFASARTDPREAKYDELRPKSPSPGMTWRTAFIDAAALEKHHECVVFQKRIILDQETVFTAKIETPDTPVDETAAPENGYDSIWINVQCLGMGYNLCETAKIN